MSSVLNVGPYDNTDQKDQFMSNTQDFNLALEFFKDVYNISDPNLIIIPKEEELDDAINKIKQSIQTFTSSLRMNQKKPPSKEKDSAISKLQSQLTKAAMTLQQMLQLKNLAIQRKSFGQKLDLKKATMSSAVRDLGEPVVNEKTGQNDNENEAILRKTILSTIETNVKCFPSFDDYAGGFKYKEYVRTSIIRRFAPGGFKESREKNLRDMIGYFMFGPGGTGKTQFAKALAGELYRNGVNVTFFNVSPAVIKQSLVGMSEKAIKFLFEEARARINVDKNQVVIIFFDEYDGLISKSSSGSVEAGTLAEMNQQMTAENQVGLIVVTATNNPEQFTDPQISRLSNRFLVWLPDLDTIRQVILLQIKSRSPNAFAFSGIDRNRKIHALNTPAAKLFEEISKEMNEAAARRIKGLKYVDNLFLDLQINAPSIYKQGIDTVDFIANILYQNNYSQRDIFSVLREVWRMAEDRLETFVTRPVTNPQVKVDIGPTKEYVLQAWLTTYTDIKVPVSRKGCDFFTKKRFIVYPIAFLQPSGDLMDEAQLQSLFTGKPKSKILNDIQIQREALKTYHFRSAMLYMQTPDKLISKLDAVNEHKMLITKRTISPSGEVSFEPMYFQTGGTAKDIILSASEKGLFIKGFNLNSAFFKNVENDETFEYRPQVLNIINHLAATAPVEFFDFINAMNLAPPTNITNAPQLWRFMTGGQKYTKEQVESGDVQIQNSIRDFTSEDDINRLYQLATLSEFQGV